MKIIFNEYEPYIDSLNSLMNESYYELYPLRYNMEDIKKIVSKKGLLAFGVDEKTKAVAGFALMGNQIDYWELYYIYVNKKFRIQNVAYEILSSALKKVKIGKVFLEVDAENISAIRLYKKFLWIETGIRKKYYQNGHDALVGYIECKK